MGATAALTARPLDASPARLRPLAWWALALVMAVPRLVVLPLNENLHGDAIARVWIASHWATEPHVIGSFDQGAYQFGPLHIYLLALAQWLWPSPAHAGRVLSLVLGVLTVFPLVALARRELGERSARWSAVLLALWGLHVQSSTTAASEALNLLLIVAAVERVSAFLAARGDRQALLAGALWLNLACATRYDSWLIVVLAALAVLWRTRDVWTMVWFGAASSAFAVAWMFGNVVDRGDPLYPLRYIDDFHRAWYPSEEAAWGRPTYTVLTLFFWPATAALTLTPMVTLAGLAGLVRAWREDRARWLVLVIVVPVALYTFRSVALHSFCPLARFTMKELALALPFVWLGVEPWLTRRWMRAATRATALVLALWLVGLGAFCFRNEAPLAKALGPVAATSTVEGWQRRAARAIEAACAEGGLAVIDEDPKAYDDMPIASLVTARQARRRSRRYEEAVRAAPLGVVLRFEGGALERSGELALDGPTPRFRGIALEELGGVDAPLHLYRPTSRP